MNRQVKEFTKTARPRRGQPEQTRQRLIMAASLLFNQHGFHGTDSNRIAREACYAAGTFYKHFKDKKEIFLAAYEMWLSEEWKTVEAAIAKGGEARSIARELVKISIEFHTNWRGLRAALLELVFSDTEVRAFYRAQRRRQLDIISEIRRRIHAPSRRREDDAIHLFTTERVFDAIANGELRALGLNQEIVVEEMVERIAALLK